MSGLDDTVRNPLLELSRDPVCAIDELGYIVHANSAWHVVLGYSAGEIVGSPFGRLFPGKDANVATRALQDSLAGRGTVTFECRVRRRTGEFRRFTWRLNPHAGVIWAVCSPAASDSADEKALLRALIQNASEPIVIKDRDGRYLLMTATAAGRLGRTSQDVVGMRDRDFYDQETWREIVEIDQRVMEERRPFTYEQVREIGGDQRVFLTTKSPFLGPDSEVRGIIGVSHDITVRSAEQERIRRAEERFRKIADSIPLPVVICRPDDGRILYANAHLAGVLWTELDALIGQSLGDWFAEPRELGAVVDQVRGSQLVHDHEVRLTGSDGSTFWALATVVQTTFDGGDALVASFQDISKLKKAEANLQRARREAEAASAAKSALLTMMSHEIRTPLNGLLGMTELLLGTELGPRQQEYAESALRAGTTLLALLNDLLDLSKIEAGKLEIEILPFDPWDVVDSVMSLAATRAHQKGLELLASVESSVPRRVTGDGARLQQVITNLLGNAVKFTDQGEVVVRARRLEDVPGVVRLRFEVSDTGIGIDQALHERVFSSFRQADSSMTRRFGGTGLGLAICKQLVTLMDGEMGLSSEIGEGSTFWFEIRLGEVDEISDVHDAIDAELAERTAGGRVLVVDDNASARNALLGMLRRWGIEGNAVASVADLTAVLNRAVADQAGYTAVLLDLTMPSMETAEEVGRLREDPIVGLTPVIGMAPVLSDGAALPAAELLSAYLHKPVAPNALRRALVAALGGSVDDAEGDAAQAPVVPDFEPPNGKRVLVVDDNPINRELATHQLQRLGYACDTVESGRMALSLLQGVVYDAVLMDCQMPEMDGFETTSALREREGEKRHTPVVAMTAHALRGDRQRCIDAGMDDYLAKPVKLHQLRGVLSRWVLKPSDPNATPEGGRTTRAVRFGSGRRKTTEGKRGRYGPWVGSSQGDSGLAANVASMEADFGRLDTRRLLGTVLEDARRSLGRIQVALDGRDAKLLAAAAHRLKGTCGVVASERFLATCNRLQDEASGRTLAEGPALLVDLEAEIVELGNLVASRA